MIPGTVHSTHQPLMGLLMRIRDAAAQAVVQGREVPEDVGDETQQLREEVALLRAGLENHPEVKRFAGKFTVFTCSDFHMLSTCPMSLVFFVCTIPPQSISDIFLIMAWVT